MAEAETSVGGGGSPVAAALDDKIRRRLKTDLRVTDLSLVSVLDPCLLV